MTVETATQLSLFDRLAEATPGEIVKHPLTEDRIGGQLFEAVSRGMYTKPQHAIREYVQNAIDAGAESVRIHITANSVVITDDGTGMTPDELDHARDFGSSEKSYGEAVGFRGIGIYSGLHLCDAITITTKTAGADRTITMVIDSKGLRERLRKDRQKTRQNRTQFLPLANEFTSFYLGDEADTNAHFTVVTLDGINPTYIAKLSDRSELRRYIVQNLPVAFADDFPGRTAILNELKSLIPSFNMARIILQSEAGPAETITRPTIPNLRDPEMKLVKKGGRPICFIWSCLHKGGKKIPDAFKDYQGFVYKVQGFTIGDNLKLQSMFKKGNQGLYKWYTGEVYVLDPDVVPTTERDDFEAGAAFDYLESELRKVMSKLDVDALAYQESERAREVFDKGYPAFQKIKQEITDSTNYDRALIFARLQSLWRDLKGKKAKASGWRSPDGHEAAEFLAAVAELRDSVQAVINKPQRGDQQVRDLAGRGADAGVNGAENTNPPSGPAGNPVGDQNGQQSFGDDLEPEPAPPNRTLVSVLKPVMNF